MSRSVSDDLNWWRAYRDAGGADRAALASALARLQGWKAQHDADRARQPGPFLKMAWDGVFGDEDDQVVRAIGEIEAALAKA
jgi:hypothetical protein